MSQIDVVIVGDDFGGDFIIINAWEENGLPNGKSHGDGVRDGGQTRAMWVNWEKNASCFVK